MRTSPKAPDPVPFNLDHQRWYLAQILRGQGKESRAYIHLEACIARIEELDAEIEHGATLVLKWSDKAFKAEAERDRMREAATKVRDEIHLMLCRDDYDAEAWVGEQLPLLHDNLQAALRGDDGDD